MNHPKTPNLCWGCLSSGRNKVLANYDILQFLYDVIGDDKILDKDFADMKFCWECTAMFGKLIRFRNQVRDSYAAMKNCLEKNLDTATLEKPSKINLYKVFNISVDKFTEDREEEICNVPKIEDQSFEDHAASVDQYSDDNNYYDIPLTKRKKPFKKRRKKKHTISEKYKEIELSREDIEKERYLFSSREEFVNAHFKCLSCLDIFANADDFKDHNESKHTVVTAYKCDICQNYLNSDMSLTYHRYTHARRYVCAICARAHNTKRMAERHYDTTHLIVPDMDPDVPEPDNSERQNNSQDNIAQNGTENLYTCQHCSKKFKWKTSLHRHIMVHEIADGRKRQPYCEACGLSFTSTPNLRNHIKTSSKHQIQLKLMKLKESQSQTEGDVEEIKGSILKKMQTFPCEMCEKSFQWRGNLVRHLQSHATKANRSLLCEPCNRTFSSIATYKQHMQISKQHASERQFKYTCSDCGKKFPIKQKLKDHINWEHLKNYVYNCDECQKVFKHRLNLQQHVQTVHNKNCGDQLCHQCGKAFPNKSKLTSHVLAVHSSSPHKCKLCGARFGWRSCLARHMKRLHFPKAQEIKT